MGGALSDIRIGLIGSGFMGQAHADAFRRAALLYPKLPARPVLAMLADRDEPTAAAAAARFGFARSTGDWRRAGQRPRRRRRRHHLAEQPPSRDGACRAQGRQARLLREAAGGDGGRGRGDGGRRGAERRQDDGRLQQRQDAGGDVRQEADRRAAPSASRSASAAGSTRASTPIPSCRGHGAARGRKPAPARSATSARTRFPSRNT